MAHLHHLLCWEESWTSKTVCHDTLNVDILAFVRAPQFQENVFARTVFFRELGTEPGNKTMHVLTLADQMQR